MTSTITIILVCVFVFLICCCLMVVLSVCFFGPNKIENLSIKSRAKCFSICFRLFNATDTCNDLKNLSDLEDLSFEEKYKNRLHIHGENKPRCLLLANYTYTSKTFQSLDTPKEDLKAMKRMMENCGLHVEYFTNKNSKEIKKILFDFTNHVMTGPIFFFYSGHGVGNKEKPEESYIVGVDGSTIDLFSNFIKAPLLEGIDKVLILDQCRSFVKIDPNEEEKINSLLVKKTYFSMENRDNVMYAFAAKLGKATWVIKGSALSPLTEQIINNVKNNLQKQYRGDLCKAIMDASGTVGEFKLHGKSFSYFVSNNEK